jgi:hypothetical protein
VAFSNSAGREIDLCVDTEAAHDTGNRVPHHLGELTPRCGSCHRLDAFL